MNEERPVVFTISGDKYFSIQSKDARAASIVYSTVAAYDIYRLMVHISCELNDKGYAVLFEVD